MTRKRRIVRSLELDEVSAVGTPAQAGALHAITKSEPVLTPEQKAFADAWAAQFLKQRQEALKMDDVTTDWPTLVSHYAEKWDVTEEDAGIRLTKERPDLVAKAYESEQAAYVQRQVERRKAAYGE